MTEEDQGADSNVGSEGDGPFNPLGPMPHASKMEFYDNLPWLGFGGAALFLTLGYLLDSSTLFEWGFIGVWVGIVGSLMRLI